MRSFVSHLSVSRDVPVVVARYLTGCLPATTIKCGFEDNSRQEDMPLEGDRGCGCDTEYSRAVLQISRSRPCYVDVSKRPLIQRMGDRKGLAAEVRRELNVVAHEDHYFLFAYSPLLFCLSCGIDVKLCCYSVQSGWVVRLPMVQVVRPWTCNV